MKRRRRGLNGLFDELNERYFEGCLPRYRVSIVKDLGGKDGEYIPERRLIRIGRGHDGETIRKILLHEMCHVATGPSHGKRFIGCLLRLAEQGERWAEEEAEKIQETEHPASYVKSRIEEVVLYLPAARFAEVARVVARELGMRPKEFLRRFPWAERTWINAVREIRMRWR